MTLDQFGDCLTVEEAACVLRLSRNSAYAGVKDGSLPAIRVGRRIIVPKQAIKKMLEVPVGADAVLPDARR